MALIDKRRFQSLSSLFSYLESRRSEFAGQGERFAIILYVGDYFHKEEKSEAKLIAICETARAAHFIVRLYKQQEGLNFLPVIHRTNAELYPTTSHVEAYLQRLERELVFLKKRDQEGQSQQTKQPHNT